MKTIYDTLMANDIEPRRAGSPDLPFTPYTRRVKTYEGSGDGRRLTAEDLARLLAR